MVVCPPPMSHQCCDLNINLARSPEEHILGVSVCIKLISNISAKMKVGTYIVFAWVFCCYMLCQIQLGYFHFMQV